MSKKLGIAILALIGVAIVIALATGRFSSTGAGAERASVGEASQHSSDNAALANSNAQPASTDSFRVFILQSVDSKVELNRFKFPYADIARQSDYASLVGVLSEMPDSRFRADTYTIFRTIDQVPVAFGKEVTAVEGSNTGLLLLPNEAVKALGGPEAAFGFYFDQLRQLPDD